MSIPRKMTVNCSKCGKPLSVTVFESINTDYAENISSQIISGELFNAKCPHCNFVSHLEYDMLYHDLKHGAMIWVVHPNGPEYQRKIAEVRSTQLVAYKTLRIVHDMNALKEKVSCLENNRDDRIIELCKVFFAYNLLSQQPDFDFRNAFYTSVSGKNLIYFYDHDNNNMCCEMPDEVYNYLKELYYGSHHVSAFDENYAIVDYEWAEAILNSLLEENIEPPSSVESSKDITESNNSTQTIEKKSCPTCNAAIPIDSSFCPKCGAKLITHVQRERIDRVIYEEMYGDYGSQVRMPQSEAEWETLAYEMGISVATTKELRKREYELVRSTKEKYIQNSEKWMAEAIELEKIYPQFSILKEIKNAKFKELIQHVDMRSAYELLHKDELFVSKTSNIQQNATSTMPVSAKPEYQTHLLEQQKQEAIQKRIAETKAAEKKKKILRYIILAVIVIWISISITRCTMESVHNSKLRNFATETMSDDYNNVYADIVSMEPEYFVYTSYNNGPYSISEVVCKCKTVEGEIIWATIYSWKYPGGSSHDEEKNEAQYYSKSNPMKLTGSVTTAENIIDRLATSIGNVFVLNVTSMELQ